MRMKIFFSFILRKARLVCVGLKFCCPPLILPPENEVSLAIRLYWYFTKFGLRWPSYIFAYISVWELYILAI